MERALLWFKCAAVHDPVRPVIKKPAVLGWMAKHRRVDLEIERPMRGEELLHQMKGWFTVDVHQAGDVIQQYGKLMTLDETDLVVETKDATAMELLSQKLAETFGRDVWLEPIAKKLLK
ncbi:MAG: hypothetical protein P1P89_15245 [Desulfobacterales bacterium]|nr:hypothetical protein [Desulfobacterales bacterium]